MVDDAALHPWEYLQETFHATSGWMRVIGGDGLLLAGMLARNDAWRRRGMRTRLLGTLQCRTGARASAIRRLVDRYVARVR